LFIRLLRRDFCPARFYPEEIPDAFAGVFAPGMVLAML
jgi:hypothetical protein